MAFTFAEGVGAGATTSGTTLSATTTTSLTAGDLLVGIVTWEDGAVAGDVAYIDDTDAANALTMLAIRNDGNNYMRMGYLEVPSNKATVTFRATLGTARTYRGITVLRFSATAGGIHLDPDGYTGSPGNGSSTSVASGNITTSGTDMLVVAFQKQYFGATEESNWQIGASAADSHYETAAAFTDSWWLIGASGTVNGTLTLGNSAVWLADIIGFRIGAGGSTPAATTLPPIAAYYRRRMEA